MRESKLEKINKKFMGFFDFFFTNCKAIQKKKKGFNLISLSSKKFNEQN